MRFVLASLLLCMAALCVSPALAAPPWTAQERCFDAARLAAVMTGTMLREEFGSTNPADALAVAGEYGSSGWTMSINGAVNGTPVSLSYIGTFDSGTGLGAFTDSGMTGLDPWQGSGTYQYTDINAIETETTWDQIAGRQPEGTPGFSFIRYDRHVIKRWRNDDGTDSFTYQRTIFGIPFGSVRRGESASSGRETRSATYSMTAIDDFVSISGINDYTTQTFAGTLTVVPEPAALSLLLVSLVGRACVRRRKP